MAEPEEPSEQFQPPPLEVFARDDIGITLGEGHSVHGRGPDSEGIRVGDSRGLSLGGEVQGITTKGAWATAPPSHGEEGTSETCAIFVQSQNAHSPIWGQPIMLPEWTGVDGEAPDLQNPSRPPLKMAVSRAYQDGEFLERLGRGTSERYETAEVSPGNLHEWIEVLWTAVLSQKLLRAEPGVVVLLNARWTPWLALHLVAEGFRKRYGEAARRVADGARFDAIWVVGPSDDLVERLDTPTAP
jgi:hypothetical protein